MKTSLRRRYILLLLRLLLLLFLFQIIAFSAYEVVEWREWGTTEHVKEDAKELLVLIGVDLVVLPFMMLVAWNISGKMLAPLQSVAETSRRISAGILNERVASPVPDAHIESLVDSINGAFDKYQDALQRLQRFTSDASHQLRTPLAAMRSMGEVSLRQERSPAEYRETLGAMLEEVARLSSIVEKLLLLARLERTEVRQRWGRVELSPLVDDIVQTFTLFAQDRRIAMVLEAEGGLAVEGDADLLHQVFANLIDNAVRYTPLDGTIRMKFARVGREVRFVISDSGPGIPEEFRARIFERFSRAPGALGQGSGLGLAIVADIVRLHGGTVEAVAGALGGAEFRVTLPGA